MAVVVSEKWKKGEVKRTFIAKFFSRKGREMKWSHQNSLPLG
jgi:hypothetical protein